MKKGKFKKKKDFSNVCKIMRCLPKGKTERFESLQEPFHNNLNPQKSMRKE